MIVVRVPAGARAKSPGVVIEDHVLLARAFRQICPGTSSFLSLLIVSSSSDGYHKAIDCSCKERFNRCAISPITPDASLRASVILSATDSGLSPSALPPFRENCPGRRPGFKVSTWINGISCRISRQMPVLHTSAYSQRKCSLRLTKRWWPMMRWSTSSMSRTRPASTSCLIVSMHPRAGCASARYPGRLAPALPGWPRPPACGS